MLDQKEKRHSVRPAVDVLFESAADIYGHKLLAIILTGMGQDGMAGCKLIKEKRGTVLIQDEASSAVWGMPGAVYRLGAYDKVCTLEDMEQLLARTLGRAA
jgi:two-component system chemotaxis response regulator CheB